MQQLRASHGSRDGSLTVPTTETPFPTFPAGFENGYVTRAGNTSYYGARIILFFMMYSTRTFPAALSTTAASRHQTWNASCVSGIPATRRCHLISSG